MVIPNSLVDLVEFSSWPKKIHMKFIPHVEEIFDDNLCWKLVDRDVVSRDILRKKYKRESVLICYNPLIPTQEVKVCISESDIDDKIKELEQLKWRYDERVNFTRICESRKWIGYGSEQEVDETKFRLTEENISFEWIGPLLSRREGVSMMDMEAVDLPNGYICFTPDPDVYFDSKPRTKLDISFQVCTPKHNIDVQTDLCLINELFECTTLKNMEQVIDEVQCNDTKDSTMPSSVDQSINALEQNQNKCNPYFQSFVNIENRHRLISSVDWHPCRKGYVAIAYYSPKDKNKENYLIKGESNLVIKKRFFMNEDDLCIDEKIFNCDARATRSDDKDENDVDGEDDNGKNRSLSPTKLIMYQSQDLSLKYMMPSEYGNTCTPTKETIDKSDEPIYGNRQYIEQCSNAAINSFNISSPPSSSHEDSTTSEESDTSTTSPSKPVVLIQENMLPDEIEECEDDLQITDTDSIVLIWDCDDSLNPKMKLLNTHDINVIKFYPRNGDFVVGGSINGQIVVWNLETEWKKAASMKHIDDNDVILNFIKYLPGWKATDDESSTIYPVVLSERSVSHLACITSLEWIHPSLEITSEGKFVQLEGRESSRQVLSSSMDGCIKVWNIKTRSDGKQIMWSLELVYVVIASDISNKYWIPITSFQLLAPSFKYFCKDDEPYQCNLEMAAKFRPIIALVNDIGQIGVIRWLGRDDEQIENCKPKWWSQCHDGKIVSLSKNYYFSNIVLATGGHIFSIWNIEYGDEPIWWQQCEENVTLTQGCFSSFHPGIFYIGRSDGKVNLWNIRKQIHKPDMEIRAFGYSVIILSVVAPSCSEYQISIATLDGNFHLLSYKYDTSWNKEDFAKLALFFKETNESRKKYRSVL